MNKITECSRYQLKNFCRYLTANPKAFEIICSFTLIVVKKYYLKLYNKELKAVNFTLVDIAILEGIDFLKYFLTLPISNSSSFDEILEQKVNAI